MDKKLNNKDLDEKKKNKIGKNIFSIIAISIFILCVIYIFKSIRANKNNTLPYVFGISYSVVPTPSMEDTIKVNDIVIIKNVNFSEIKEQDIIVYFSKKENIFIVHRVVGVYEDGSLITQGDNKETNPIVDNDPDSSDGVRGVTSALYVGKVVKSGRFLGLGWVVLHGRVFIFVAVVGVFAYLLVSEFINISRTLREKDKENEEKVNNEIDIEKERAKLRAEVLKELEKEQEEKDNK